MSLVTETKIQSIPDVSRITDAQTRAALTAIKQILDVREGKAPRNEPLDKSITWRGLYEAGLIDVLQNGKTITFNGNNSSGFVASTVVPNLSTPPAPTNVVVTAAIGTVVVRYDDPRLAYSNHARARIYRASVDDVGQAEYLGASDGLMYVDSDITSGGTYYYWVAFESDTAVIGAYNAVPGTIGQPSYDPSYVLDILTTKFKPSTAYALNSYAMPTPSAETGLWYKVTVAGTSGGTEPTWPTVVGNTVVSGTVTFEAIAAGSEVIPFIIGDVGGSPAVVMDTAYIADATITTAKIQNAFMDSLVAAQGYIGTAHIDDLAVTNAKIANAAITNAKIGNAVITGAKIASLAILTDNLEYQAVTIPNALYTSGNVNASVGITTLQSVGIVSTGATISISFAVSVLNVGNYTFAIEVYRDTTMIYSSFVFTRGNTGDTYGEAISGAISETPGAASYTYHLKINVISASGTPIAGRRSLVLLETKK